MLNQPPSLIVEGVDRSPTPAITFKPAPEKRRRKKQYNNSIRIHN